MKKQIIAGITATMTVAGNAVTLVHAENKADNTAPISQETESPLSTEQQQALAEATTAETKLNDAKTQMTTAEENTKQADKTVTETVKKHTDAMRNTAIADEAALKDVNAKKEEATKAQQELDKADKAFNDATNAYKEAESKSIDAVAAFKSAKTALDLANKHADEVTDAKVKEAADAKKTADDALTKAQTDYKNAQDAVTKAQSSADTAKTDADNAKTKATAASDAVTKAQKAVDEATTKVTEAQKKADEFKSEDALNDAIKQAQTDLDNAKAEQTKAEADLTAKQNAQEDANKALANANTALDTANQALTTAQNQLKTAQTNLDNANKAKTDAQAALDKANADKKAAETAQTTAQKAYDDAVSAYTDAAKAYEQAQAQIDAQQKIVDAAKVKADNAQAQYEKGFKGFLEDLKSKTTDTATLDSIDKAINMLNGTRQANRNGEKQPITVNDKEVTEYIKTYDWKSSAQNLDSALAAIEGMNRTNELRQAEGLSTLNTNYALIAESMIKSDIAFFTSPAQHPSLFIYSNSENLAPLHSSPIDSVDDFYSEKKIWDALEIEPVGNKTKEYYKQNTYEFFEDKYDLYLKVGHYLNIIDPAAVDVAMSRTYYKNNANLPNWEQALSNTGYASISIADYKQQLQSYVDSLKSAPETYKQELAKLTDMQSKLAAVSDRDVTAAKDKLDDANQAVKNAEAAVTEAQGNLDKANANIVQAQKNATDSQTTVTNKEADVKTAQSSVNDAQSKKTDSDNAVKAAQTAIDNAKTNVSQAQTALDAKKSALNSFNSNKAQAEKELADANSTLSKANTDKANADSALATALNAQQTADKKLEEATLNYNKAKETETTKKTAYDKASKDAQAATQKVDLLNRYKAEITNVQKNFDEKQAVSNKALDAMDDAAKDAAVKKKAAVDANMRANHADIVYTQAQKDYQNAKDGKPSAYKDLAEAVNAEAKAQKEAEKAQAGKEAAEAALTKAKDDEAKAQEAFDKALDELAKTVIIDEDDCDSETVDDENVELEINGFDDAVNKLVDKNDYYKGLKTNHITAFSHIYDRDTDEASLAKLKAYALSKGYTPVDYFDLGVKEYSNDETKTLSELPSPVTYTFDLEPVANRTYHLNRLHNGVIEDVPLTNDNGHFTFTNTKYSAFLLSYTETPTQIATEPQKPQTSVKVEGDAENTTNTSTTTQAQTQKTNKTTPTTKTATTAKTSNAKATTKQTKKTQSPETSDPTEMAGWMMALIISAGAAFVTAKKTKKD